MTPQIDKLTAKAAMTDQNANYAAKGASKKRPMKVKDINILLTRFWRRYGVKASFFFTFFVIWTGFKNIIVDHDPKVTSENFSSLQTFWLFAHRVVTLFIVNFTLPGCVSLLLYNLGSAGYDEYDEEDEEVSTKKHDPIRLILRIVTRGDYPKLIRDTVEYHENLFKSYWRQDEDEIEIHVMSEMPMKLNRPKRNGTAHRCEVKEFDIPPDYCTPNNTLYKVRSSILFAV